MRGELVLLILHEGNQRTHDDRQPGQEQRGELIHQRLPASRGHHDDGVASLQYSLNRLPLPLLKVAVPEAVVEDRPGTFFRYGRRHGAERQKRTTRRGDRIAELSLSAVGYAPPSTTSAHFTLH